MKRMTPFWKFVDKLRSLVGFEGNKVQIGNDLEVDGDLTINGGDVVQAVSGTSEGDNWKTLTIGDTTKNLGGGGATIESGSLPIGAIPDNVTLKTNKWISDGNTFKVIINVQTSLSSITIKNNDLNFKFMESNIESAGMSLELFNKLKTALQNVEYWNGLLLINERNASAAGTQVKFYGATAYWGSTGQVIVFAPDIVGGTLTKDHDALITFEVPLI